MSEREEPAEGAIPPVLRETLAHIRDDREHGASWLARLAAQSLADTAAELLVVAEPVPLDRVKPAVRALATVRPSMAALANTVALIWAAAVGEAQGSQTDALHRLRTSALELVARWDESPALIERAAVPFLQGKLYTHSRSGTVEHALIDMTRQGTTSNSGEIVVAESRPGGEGIAAARALAEAGWYVTLIPDTASGLFVKGCSAVVVGADSVRADGSVVNKVGTYPLAVMAREVSVPVYVLCETLKIAGLTFPVNLEEMDPREILPEPVPNVTVRNVYFDVTLAELVRHIITEDGVLDAQAIQTRAEQAGAALRLLESG